MELKTLALASVVIFLVLFSTTFVYSIVDSYGDLFINFDLFKRFYSSDLDSSKTTIFLLGSSQVLRMDMTYINQEILNFCDNCVAYNLALQGDTISRRLGTIPNLIEKKPDLIIYGIGYVDFVLKRNADFAPVPLIQKPKSFLPDPQSLIEEKIIHANFPNDVNPKYFTFNVLKSQFKDKTSLDQTILDPNDRIFKDDKDFKERDYLSLSNEELDKKFPLQIAEYSKIDLEIYEKRFPELKQILEELKNNDIKVSIFSTPTPQTKLEKVSNSNEELFRSTFEKLSKEYGVSTYFLHHKFSNMTIWSDVIHISLNKEAMQPYSEEIVKIIKNEVVNG